MIIIIIIIIITSNSTQQQQEHAATAAAATTTRACVTPSKVPDGRSRCSLTTQPTPGTCRIRKVRIARAERTRGYSSLPKHL